jgi:hypothetical protein
MILTAHQPVYLPWLGLFHKIALADKFIFFDRVQYVPKDWISRNQIKGPQGAVMLTVPALRKGYLEKKIADIEINNELPWARKHWKTILLSYGKSPYFKQYADFFEDIYNKPWTLLADLNFTMLHWFLVTLGIKTALEKAGSYTFEGAKSDLVLDMCVKLDAHVYIFGALGKDYADHDAFTQAGVTPVFQDYHHPTYKQLHGDFLPYMSIIDLLFNEGPHSLDILMSGNITAEQLRAMTPGR